MHIGEKFFTDEELRKFEFKHLGGNVKIKRNASIFFVENVSIGDNVRIDDFTIIVAAGSECNIGSHIHIASHCFISASGGLEIGDFCGMAPGSMIFSNSSDYSGKSLNNPTIYPKYVTAISKKVVLGKHVILGAGSIVLPGCVLGEGVSVGAQSLVTKSLPPWGMYFGSPAKLLKRRKKDMLNLEREFLAEYRVNNR